MQNRAARMIHTLLPVLFGIAVDVNGACLDADPGCTEYLRLGDSCYSEWAEKHCKRTCGKCDPDPDPAPSASAPLTAVTSSGKKFQVLSRTREGQENFRNADSKHSALAPGTDNNSVIPLMAQRKGQAARNNAAGEGISAVPLMARRKGQAARNIAAGKGTSAGETAAACKKRLMQQFRASRDFTDNILPHRIERANAFDTEDREFVAEGGLFNICLNRTMPQLPVVEAAWQLISDAVRNESARAWWIPENKKRARGWVLSPLGLLVPEANCDQDYHVLHAGECVAAIQAIQAHAEYYQRPSFGRRIQVGPGYPHVLYGALAAVAAKEDFSVAEIGARLGIYAGTSALLAKRIHPEVSAHITTLEVDHVLNSKLEEMLEINLKGQYWHNQLTSGLVPDEDETVTLRSMFKAVDHVDILYWMPQFQQEQLVADYNIDVLNSKVCRVFIDVYESATVTASIHRKLIGHGWVLSFMMRSMGWSYTYQHHKTAHTLSAGQSPFGPINFPHYASMLYIQPQIADHICAGRILDHEYAMASELAGNPHQPKEPDTKWTMHDAESAEDAESLAASKICAGSETACVASAYTGYYSHTQLQTEPRL